MATFKALRVFIVLTVLAGGVALGIDEWQLRQRTPAPKSGTIIGFRFSGDFPHRCRLWLKPTGETISHRVLINPNSEAECLSARIGDHWERVPGMGS